MSRYKLYHTFNNELPTRDRTAPERDQRTQSARRPGRYRDRQLQQITCREARGFSTQTRADHMLFVVSWSRHGDLHHIRTKRLWCELHGSFQMTGTELLSHALILDALQERGLIDKDTLHDRLDELIEQDRAEASRLELEALNAVEDD